MEERFKSWQNYAIENDLEGEKMYHQSADVMRERIGNPSMSLTLRLSFDDWKLTTKLTAEQRKKMEYMADDEGAEYGDYAYNLLELRFGGCMSEEFEAALVRETWRVYDWLDDWVKAGGHDQ